LLAEKEWGEHSLSKFFDFTRVSPFPKKEGALNYRRPTVTPLPFASPPHTLRSLVHSASAPKLSMVPVPVPVPGVTPPSALQTLSESASVPALADVLPPAPVSKEDEGVGEMLPRTHGSQGRVSVHGEKGEEKEKDEEKAYRDQPLDSPRLKHQRTLLFERIRAKDYKTTEEISRQLDGGLELVADEDTTDTHEDDTARTRKRRSLMRKSKAPTHDLERWLVSHGRTPLSRVDENEKMRYRMMFELLDADGGGTLDVDEIYDALKYTGVKMTRRELVRLCHVAGVEKGEAGTKPSVDVDGFTTGFASSSEWDTLFEVYKQRAAKAVQERKQREEEDKRQQARLADARNCTIHLLNKLHLAHTCAHTHIHTHIHTHTHTHTHRFLNICAHTQIFTHLYTRTLP
jgi:hypothetical protein